MGDLFRIPKYSEDSLRLRFRLGYIQSTPRECLLRATRIARLFKEFCHAFRSPPASLGIVHVGELGPGSDKSRPERSVSSTGDCDRRRAKCALRSAGTASAVSECSLGSFFRLVARWPRDACDHSVRQYHAAAPRL